MLVLKQSLASKAAKNKAPADSLKTIKSPASARLWIQMENHLGIES